MRNSLGILSGSALLFLLPVLPATAFAQHLPAPSKPEAKVCVAQVANLSAESVREPWLTTQLSSNLKRFKLDVLTLESRTPARRRIELDLDTAAEVRDKNCDYVLLTQIVDLRRGILGSTQPNISLGKRIPGTDASEGPGLGRQNDVQLRYALFRIGRPEPVFEDAISEQSSTSTNYNVEADVDREAARIRHELTKK